MPAVAAAAKLFQSCLTLCDPTRLLCPWDSPGKNTGVGCHFLLQCMKVKSESEVAQSCLTLRNPMNCSQAPLSMGFYRQEYWSGLPLPSPQYASKYGKFISGHKTGKGQLSFQSQKRTIPKNVQTFVRLPSFHMLAGLCSKSFKLGFSST